ncbi:MAG: hypothetical protein K0S61_731 [Anaerocolumna sp.]|jgi:hypothetical protein|nr:hypothetical protein [Anaerocolumna sp.]
MRKVILEDLDFTWEPKDIEKAKLLWREGLSLEAMSRAFKREPTEVFMLLVHLNRKDSIKPRKGYIWGGVQDSNCN